MGIICISFGLNLVGIAFVSRSFWLFSANAVVAFTVLCVLSIPRLHFGRFDNPAVNGRSIQWSQLRNVLIYNSAGYDAACSLVKFSMTPRRTVPRAMVAVGVTTTALYVVTLTLPFLATNYPYQSWKPGFFCGGST